MFSKWILLLVLASVHVPEGRFTAQANTINVKLLIVNTLIPAGMRYLWMSQPNFVVGPVLEVPP